MTPRSANQDYALDHNLDAMREAGLSAHALQRQEERLAERKKSMLIDGYDFGVNAHGGLQIYPPSTLTADDPEWARKVQPAYDAAMAVWNGGDPGLEYIEGVFADLFDDD